MFNLLVTIPTITLDVTEPPYRADQTHIEPPLELAIYNYQRRGYLGDLNSAGNVEVQLTRERGLAFQE